MYHPRLTLEIPQDLKFKMDRLIPYGLRKKIFTMLLQDVLEAIDKNPEKVMGAIMARDLRAKDFTKELST
jgi:hypothetical protein